MNTLKYMFFIGSFLIYTSHCSNLLEEEKEETETLSSMFRGLIISSPFQSQEIHPLHETECKKETLKFENAFPDFYCAHVKIIGYDKRFYKEFTPSDFFVLNEGISIRVTKYLKPLSSQVSSMGEEEYKDESIKLEATHYHIKKHVFFHKEEKLIAPIYIGHREAVKLFPPLTYVLSGSSEPTPPNSSSESIELTFSKDSPFTLLTSESSSEEEEKKNPPSSLASSREDEFSKSQHNRYILKDDPIPHLTINGYKLLSTLENENPPPTPIGRGNSTGNIMRDETPESSPPYSSLDTSPETTPGTTPEISPFTTPEPSPDILRRFFAPKKNDSEISLRTATKTLPRPQPGFSFFNKEVPSDSE